MSDVRPSEEHDISKYPAGLTGWGGCDLNDHIARWDLRPAYRTRVGNPGDTRGMYKAGTAVLPNGDIICAPCRNRTPEKLPFTMHVFRSQDNGGTWQEIGQTPMTGKEPSLTCLRNGVLVMTTEDLSGEKTPVYRSDDGGVVDVRRSGNAPRDHPRRSRRRGRLGDHVQRPEVRRGRA